jgi:hypothetical protein
MNFEILLSKHVIKQGLSVVFAYVDKLLDLGHFVHPVAEILLKFAC